MVSTPILKVRPDPMDSLRGAFRWLVRICNWHLRHYALFHWGSKVDSQEMALPQAVYEYALARTLGTLVVSKAGEREALCRRIGLLQGR